MADEQTIAKPKIFNKQVTLGNVLSIISMCFAVISAAWYVASAVLGFTATTNQRLDHAEWQMQLVQQSLGGITRKLDSLVRTREGMLVVPHPKDTADEDDTP